MKKRTTKGIAIFLATAMLSMQVTSVTAFAQEPDQVDANVATSSAQEVNQSPSEEKTMALTEGQPQAGNADLKNQMKTSDGVEVNYDITAEDGIFKIYYDIGDSADGDVVLDFSIVIDMINEWYRKATGDENAVYKAQPADYGEVDIEVTSSNGHTYRYKDGSFRLETADSSNSENLTDFVGFDGQKIPVESLGAIARSTPMTKLFGVFSSREVTLNLVLEMKDYLEKAGYTGETALTDYMLAYYNKDLGTSYGSFTELAKEHPEKVVDMQGGMADDQYYITEDQYNDLVKKYPELMGKYAISETKSNGKVMVQLKWPEKEIAEASYELFYKELLSFSFGDKTSQEEFVDARDQWHKQDLGLKDYMDDINDTWTKVNDYLKQATAAGLNKENATKLAISMAFGFDGPWTTNSYQFFKYAWYNSIVMEQVDGDVLINKVDKETGELIENPASFQLYYYMMKPTDDGGEQQVTYYYAIDENGKGYFTEDESKAAVLITEDGSLTIKYLLPDYEYHLKETKAPEGYEVSHEDTVINVKSKENTIITVMNGKPEPTPTPSEKPTTTPKPSEEPAVTPAPSEQPVKTPAPTDTPKQTPAPTAAPAVKKTSSPQTGDTSNIEYVVFALIASGIGLATVAFARRRKQK